MRVAQRARESVMLRISLLDRVTNIEIRRRKNVVDVVCGSLHISGDGRDTRLMGMAVCERRRWWNGGQGMCIGHGANHQPGGLTSLSAWWDTSEPGLHGTGRGSGGWYDDDDFNFQNPVMKSTIIKDSCCVWWYSAQEFSDRESRDSKNLLW